MSKHEDSGLTLVEMLVVGAVLIPVLWAVLLTTRTVTDTVSVNQRSADTTRTLRTALQRVAKYLRPASIASLRVPGSGWVAPQEDTPYGALRFQLVAGLPTSSSTNLGPVRTIEFIRDENELANGKDDDGDGLVDEGSVYVSGGGAARAAIVSDIEDFKITKKDRLLELEVRNAKRDRKHRVHREKALEILYLRNN